MKTIKRNMKSLHFFVPISRVDDEQRIVEGYAFVNEVVPGEGGIRLTRAAMEAATANYVENGTVRSMHQPLAAGKPLDVTWDEKGAYLRAKIVDDQEWRKVQEGVYKGFSVGVNPHVMRGKDVTSCEWWDASLVDRGKDRDALFNVWRAEGVDANPETEREVIIERVSFAEYLEACAPSALRDMALDYLWNSLWDIQYSGMTAEEKEAAVRETCAEFTEFMVGAVATGSLPNIVDAEGDGEVGERSQGVPEITRALIEAEAAKTDEVLIARARLSEAEKALAELPATLERLQTAETTISTLTSERDTSLADLERVQGSERAALERVRALEQIPRREAPVRGPYDAVERKFGGGALPDADAQKAQLLRAELKELDDLPATSNKSLTDQRMTRISTIKRELRNIGA